MEKREIDLIVSCYGKVKGVKYDVVILPWGATEPHNLHLPYLTDCILPHDIAVDAAALALQNSGVRCMVMGWDGRGAMHLLLRESHWTLMLTRFILPTKPVPPSRILASLTI